jgi:cyanophycinase-like exopeptidase
MDALLAAAVEAARVEAATLEAAAGGVPRIVIVPVAAARQRPDLAAAHGERAFRAAAGRARMTVGVATASVVTRETAADPGPCALLERAHLVHLPGGDPDLVPSVLRDTPAWAAILRAHARGACVAGASAGAMALAARLWTRDGPADGLGLVAGAVVPHFSPTRLDAWRAVVEDGGEPLAWLGLDERTMAIGRPGEAWTVAGRGRVHVIAPGAAGPVRSAGHGERIMIIG